MQSLEVDDASSSTEQQDVPGVQCSSSRLASRIYLLASFLINLFAVVSLPEFRGLRVWEGEEVLWLFAVLTVCCAWDSCLIVTKFAPSIETIMKDESKRMTQVSKGVDRFFGRGQEMPSVSFLVNDLYMLSILMFGGACFFLTHTLMLKTALHHQADNEIITTAMIPDNKNTMEVPKELHEWATFDENHGLILPDDIADTQKGSFICTMDGTTYFSGTSDGYYSDSRISSNTLFQAHNGPSGGQQVTSFPEIHNPKHFTLIDTREEEPSFTKFCSLAKTIGCTLFFHP